MMPLRTWVWIVLNTLLEKHKLYSTDGLNYLKLKEALKTLST